MCSIFSNVKGCLARKPSPEQLQDQKKQTAESLKPTPQEEEGQTSDSDSTSLLSYKPQDPSRVRPAETYTLYPGGVYTMMHTVGRA